MNNDDRFLDYLSIVPEFLRKNVDLSTFLVGAGFFTAPASTRFHGNYAGGLYDHSKSVYLRLQELTTGLNLTWERPESVFIIGMYHDLCKHDQYRLIEEGKYEFRNDLALTGHATKSLILLSRFIRLTEEEELCIRYHMGAYEKDDWQGFDQAIRQYPNVLYTHTADMLASKVDGT